MITFSKKPPLIALCDNPCFFRITTDLPVGTENIVVHLDPYYTSGNILLGENLLYLAPGGSAEILLGEQLRTGLQLPKQFIFPEQGNVPWNAKPNLVKQYWIRANETADPNEQFITDLVNRYICRGKIPHWKSAAFYNQYDSFYDFIATTQGWLTFAPFTQTTTPEQVQKLFFMVHWAVGSGVHLTLRIRLYFTDGTTGSYTPSQQTEEVTEFAIYEFSIGQSLLGLNDYAATHYPGKTLYSYDVTVMDGATAKSTAREFILDYSTHIAERHFIFAGSLPGYDTLVAFGAGTVENVFEYDNVIQQSFGLTPIPEKKTFSAKSSEMIKANTGYISEEFAEYLPEFFESTEVYEIVNGKLIPIVFHNTSIVRKQDNSNRFFAEFEYEHAVYQITETE